MFFLISFTNNKEFNRTVFYAMTFHDENAIQFGIRKRLLLENQHVI